MNRIPAAILIVDDDKDVCETLSAILRSRGYQITSAASASEAIEKARAQFFDLVLLDIKLPDMEGTQLLSHFQKTVPETLKIIITGYASLRSATEALNIGANSYLTKPLDPDHLLKTIENRLREREQKERITGKRLAEWVKLRIRKTKSSEFEEFLEKTTATLASFALSKTQARIYIGLNTLGVASASEIASLSKIRREEVYRAMPELEKRGLITSKFGKPRRFAAIKPKVALEILTKTRIKAVKEEVNKLRQKRNELLSQLEKIPYRIEEENSIEASYQQDNVQMRLIEMTKKARQQIRLACSFGQLETVFLRNISRISGKRPSQISVRMIVGSSELGEPARKLDDVHRSRLLQLSKVRENKIEVRKVGMLPFDLLMIDGREAIWGAFQPKNENGKILWTDDSAQIGVLTMAFENLWLESDKNRQ
jgi:DNA-binding response OmpR family regulator